MKDLTPTQKRVLSFILSRQKLDGAPPTIREISDMLGSSSVNNARQHLRLIEQKGYIKLLPGLARGIRVAIGLERQDNVDDNMLRVPLVGAVAAGKPITAIENVEGYISLDRTIFKGEGLFTLRVKGDSMKDIGVLDGDIVIVRQQSHASDGEVVVVIIDGDATIKRYFRKNNRIILHAENPAYEDMIIDSQKDVWIVGKMVGVMRKC